MQFWKENLFIAYTFSFCCILPARACIIHVYSHCAIKHQHRDSLTNKRQRLMYWLSECRPAKDDYSYEKKRKHWARSADDSNLVKNLRFCLRNMTVMQLQACCLQRLFVINVEMKFVLEVFILSHVTHSEIVKCVLTCDGYDFFNEFSS